MPDPIDWSLTTFEGNRRRQHEEFRALSFREKLTIIEQMSLTAEHLASKSLQSEQSLCAGNAAGQPK